MTWFADLSPCDYFDLPGDQPPASERLRAVGWLGEEMPFPRGTTPEPVLERLALLLEAPVQPFVFGGSHPCELCKSVEFGRTETAVAGRIVRGGHANLFVPSSRDDFVYVAPSLVAHYLVKHEYRLPEPFEEALFAYPEMESSRYFLALLERGPSGPRWREALVWAVAQTIEAGKLWHEGQTALLIPAAYDLLARSLSRAEAGSDVASAAFAATTVLASAGGLARSSRQLIQRACERFAHDHVARARFEEALADIDGADPSNADEI